MTEVAQTQSAQSAEQQISDLQAKVHGEAYTSLPTDLYIPPDALEVFLEAFEGPLDLLLYLIKKQNIDILDIPIARITRQYVEYVDIMKNFKLELAADYLVMAATLAEIKSRMLLPRQKSEGEDGEEDDPRAELVRKLLEYERFQKAAEEIDALPRLFRDVFPTTILPPDTSAVAPQPDVGMEQLIKAFQNVMARAVQNKQHTITQEPLSLRERMSNVLSLVQSSENLEFGQLFDLEEGRLGIVVTFIAVLELMKQAMITVIQANPYSTIHVKGVA